MKKVAPDADDLSLCEENPTRDEFLPEAFPHARLSVFPMYTSLCASTRHTSETPQCPATAVDCKNCRGGTHVVTQFRKPFLQRQHHLSSPRESTLRTSAEENRSKLSCFVGTIVEVANGVLVLLVKSVVDGGGNVSPCAEVLSL